MTTGPARTRSMLAFAALVLALLGATPSAHAACGDLDDRCTYPTPTQGALGAVDCADHDPGAPGTQGLEPVVWFVGQNVFLACVLVDSGEDSLLLHGGDLTWRLTLVATDGAGLLTPGALLPAASTYQAEASAAAASQVYDGCAAVLGGSSCGEDTPVNQGQACQGDLAVPNPVGGGFIGDSLDNSNGAMQSTCGFAAAAGAAAPSPSQLMDYQDATLAAAVESIHDVYGLASDANDAACVYLTGTAPCV